MSTYHGHSRVVFLHRALRCDQVHERLQSQSQRFNCAWNGVTHHGLEIAFEIECLGHSHPFRVQRPSLLLQRCSVRPELPRVFAFRKPRSGRVGSHSELGSCCTGEMARGRCKGGSLQSKSPKAQCGETCHSYALCAACCSSELVLTSCSDSRLPLIRRACTDQFAILSPGGPVFTFG